MMDSEEDFDEVLQDEVDHRQVHRSNRILGKGRYGCVIEKVYVQEHAYACKIYSGTEFENDHDLLEAFKSQYDEYRKLRHANLLEIKYICKDTCDLEVPSTKVPWLLFELMETNLFQRISGDYVEELPMSISLRILVKISDGLEYLHEKEIIHKDLSSSSILLNSQNHVKIGGFPFVQFPNQASSDKQAFMAPEMMLSLHYGKPADVYSYACIVLHLMSKKLPKLADLTSENGDIHRLVKMYLGNSAPRALQDKVVEPCLRNISTDRPNIVEVNKVMKDITSKQNKHIDGVEKKDAVTIPKFYARKFDCLPDHKALCWKNKHNNSWQSLSYTEYKKRIYNVSKSFIKLGLKPQQSVAIQGSNSVEWFVSYLGAVFAGGISTGLHVTSSLKELRYILKDCKATIMVVRSQKHLDNIMEIQDQLPHLKTIVQYEGELAKNYPNLKIYTWNEFLEKGKDMEDSEIDKIIDNQKPSECAVLVYTSGTTGHPKGVMLSHDNLTWITEAIMDTIDCYLAENVLKVVVSYLPLAHIAGMLTDMFLPVAVGGTVYFAQPDVFKKNLLLETLKEIQPTMFLGVPRLWEQIKDKLKEMSRMQPSSQITDIKKALGLANCLYVFSAAASMCPETLKFFERMGITILELYGLCECTGPHTTSLKGHGQDQWKFESCGKGINGTQTKINNLDLYDESKLLRIKPSQPVGEVMFSGRHIFLGYFGKENDLVDDEKWLHSGDIGWMDEDDFLFIECRIEDLITMENSIKVSPIDIENYIKNKVPFLSNVMLIGDKRKHLTCLMTLKCVIDPNTEKATDDLHPLVKEKFKALGIKCTKVSQVMESEDNPVFNAIRDAIDDYNSEHTSINSALKVHNWTLLKTDFTVPGGELGPTLKVKRSEVERMYAKEINKLYDEDNGLLIPLEKHCHLKGPQTVDVSKVGHYGMQIVIKSHNITITIPKGAIEKGNIVEVTAAAGFFASFSFPNEYHCISPYLWIGASYEFMKPLKVEMEHHAAISQQENISKVCVMKGITNRDDFGNNYAMCEVDDKLRCEFEIDNPYCTYFTKLEYTCVASKDRKLADKVAVCYFLPKTYETDDRFTASFCFCYSLKFCKQAIENMYKEYEIKWNTLSICCDEELAFDIKEKAEDCGVKATGNDKIKANQLNLRKFSNEKEFIDGHKNDNPYPPYFEVSVHCYEPSYLLDAEFIISVKEKIKTRFNLYLPRKHDTLNSGQKRSNASGSEESSKKRKLCHEPTGLETTPTMNKLNRFISEMARHYYEIGLELDIINSRLKLIKHDTKYPGLEDKCYNMLNLWLENDTTATWKKLCNALEEINQSVLAKDIKHMILQDS